MTSFGLLAVLNGGFKNVGARHAVPEPAEWRAEAYLNSTLSTASKRNAVMAGLSARGKSRARAKNGDCHQFAPRHIPRNKVLSLKRIGWLYPISRQVARKEA